MRTFIGLGLVAAALSACSSSDGPAPYGVGPGADAGTTPTGPIDSGGGGTPDAGSTPVTALASHQKCSVPDLEKSGDGGFGVGRIRVADDGVVYMLYEGSVYRYTVVANSSSCTFTEDAAFGFSGALPADSFDLGPPGKIVVQTFFGIEVHDRTTGAPIYTCDAQGDNRLAVSPDGTTVYSLGSTKPEDSKKLVLGATACTSTTTWTPSSPWATDSTGYVESVTALGDSLVVGAQEAVFIYGLDGTQRTVFGQTSEPMFDGAGIAYANDVVVSSAGIDAIDPNAANIHRYDATGKFLKVFSITDLTGLQDTGTLGAKPEAMGIAPNGDRYLAIEGPGGSSDAQVWRLPAF